MIRFIQKHKIITIFVAMISVWVVAAFVIFIFEKNSSLSHVMTFSDALWLGIVTTFTVGYGDIVPVTLQGRVASIILMISGVSFIGVITAKMSSIFLAEVLADRRGGKKLEKLSNHFLICGWRDDIADLLRHILKFNQTLSAKDIVIVATADCKNTFCDDLEGITFIQEPFHEHEVLNKLRLTQARKVLILSDRSPPAGQGVSSAMEADAKTIMTAIAISHISKDVNVAAEIVDASLAQYLKLAGVSEVIYSRECSRLLISNASLGNGVINVLHDLLNPESGNHVSVEEIPSNFIGMNFSEFRDLFEEKHPDETVFGILENNGNPLKLKQKALKTAQNTSNVDELITNLDQIKNLRYNNPVFNPGRKYKIPTGAAAIIIKRSSRVKNKLFAA